MKFIEERILHDGAIINNDIIKVDSFLNHQIDIHLLNKFAKEVAKEFTNIKVDKVLTIETSGIAIGYALAEEFNVPLVFAKKNKSAIVGTDVYHANVKSFTRKTVSDVTVSTSYIKEGENILLADDFLANGNAGLGLVDICKQGKANVVGFATVIEKGFQGGRKALENLNIKVVSGAIIKEFKDNRPVF